MTSCSGWMVATMSRIGPTRGRSISASRIALCSSSLGAGSSRPSSSKAVIAPCWKPNRRRSRDAHRLGAAGAVERQADRGPPVDDHRVADLVADVATADVEALALGVLGAPSAAPGASS